MHKTWIIGLVGFILVFGPATASADSPAASLRKALDQVVTLDYAGNSLSDALQHLRDKTKINFVLDIITLQQMGMFMDENGNPTPVHLKVDKGTVKQALQRMLQPYNLTHVILGDSVVITTEEIGLLRQMRQRVSIDVDNVALETTLKKLARSYAISLVIDPKVAKDAQAAVTLQLEDATLETTVRLLAEMASLKSVRMGNVLFITSEAKADKLRKEIMENQVPPQFAVPMGAPARVIGGFGGVGLRPDGFPAIPAFRWALPAQPPPPSSATVPQRPKTDPPR